MERLQALLHEAASVGLQAAAQHGRQADWLLHQQGLFALGNGKLLQSALHEMCLWRLPFGRTPGLPGLSDTL